MTEPLKGARRDFLESPLAYFSYLVEHEIDVVPFPWHQRLMDDASRVLLSSKPMRIRHTQHPIIGISTTLQEHTP